MSRDMGSQKRGHKKSILALALLLLGICVLLGGCAERLGLGGTKEDAQSGSEIAVYYLESDRLTLTTRPFRPHAENFDGILNELLSAFVLPDRSGVVSALPESVSINDCTMGVDNLTVDFNAAYLGLTNVQKVLLQAAIVRTLVQLPGVLSISITVDGQIIREEDGTTLTAMNEETFLDSQGEGLSSYRYTTMELYFATPAGDRIAKEGRGVPYSSNMITQQAIAEEIISGPQTESLRPVVNPQARVNSISVSDGICYLDMNEAFNVQFDASITPQVCLYAFVNSICEAGEVTGVMFSVEGRSDVRLWGQLPLDQVYERDSDVIYRQERTEPVTE